jgi:hypothetical protein
MIPTADITPDADGGFHVNVIWDAPVDRPCTRGYLMRNRKIADRLAAAINAGAVYVDPEIRTDINGHTYVQARSLVLGRYANADLRALGF